MKLMQNPQHIYAVSDLAIVEVEYALRSHYKFSREQIENTLGNLLLHPSIKTTPLLMQEVFKIYTDHPQLSFTDCCLAIHAEIGNAKPLWTFDQKLAKQSGNRARLITE